MPSHQALKDDQLLAETYSGMAGSSLLLETPATKANIERFIKKYLGGLSPQNLQYNIAVDFATGFLDNWTPRLQQIVKAAGGNPDIFAYSTIGELEDVLQSSRTSKTDQKKAYKAATDVNIPLVFETDKYAVYQPKTWEASRKYFGAPIRTSLLDGEQKKGATWCTSATDNKHFNEYVNKRGDRLLYFIRKKDDKLFAARSRKTTDDRYQKWLSRLPDIQKKIDAIANSAEYAAAKKMKDKFEFEQYNRQMRAWAREMESRELLEARNQQNEQVWRLSDLLEELTKKTITIPEYIAFIKFVVFGKTD